MPDLGGDAGGQASPHEDVLSGQLRERTLTRVEAHAALELRLLGGKEGVPLGRRDLERSNGALVLLALSFSASPGAPPSSTDPVGSPVLIRYGEEKSSMTHSRHRLAAVLLTAMALVAACGDDEDGTTATGDEGTASTTTTAASGAETVTVTAVDYKFEGLPEEVPAGTKVDFKNESTKELHEFVAVRIPDTEKRPVSELVKLPESETQKIFGSGPPATVLLAPPGGGKTIEAVGNGTLSETGRYAVVCFIPTGVDPQAYLKAAQESQEGPPDVPGGPPHVANGMFAELKVT